MVGYRSARERVIMQTDRLHGDVIAGMSAYHELDHELVTADTKVPGYRSGWPAHELASWGAGGDRELTGDQVDRLLQVAQRPDAGVQRDVLAALRLDSLVPLTVDARVGDGIVTLAGTVGSEQERQDARQVAGSVPGVAGIIDDLVRIPAPGTGETATEEVAAALARSTIASVAELTVDQPSPGTVVLTGAVGTRRDHDLAAATAWSVPGVTAVDDCTNLEC
jgi:osmotically-inducible protein OsmY